jgi:hypothetical protein
VDISSHDVDRALELLDQMPEHHVAALRERIAVLDAGVRAGRHAGDNPITTSTGWEPVAAAMVFILWTTTEASLARSLRC